MSRRSEDSLHRLELVRTFLHALVWAECSCGWVGAMRDDEDSASADFERHLKEDQ